VEVFGMHDEEAAQEGGHRVQ